MATETKDIILDINISYKDAINSIVQLQKQLDELSVEQMKVNAAFKNGEKTRQEADKELEAIAAQTRLLKQAQREYRKEIDANLQAEEANNGSLKQMRAELKNLIREYDSLSKADRESAIGEQKMQEINQLQDSLKQLEGATGRFQRNVGDYENAIRRALEGTIPMRQAMKELKTEIQTLSYQYANQGTVIQQQERQLAELGQTIGTDTDEYRQQSAALEQLKKDYDATGQELDKMKQAAGQMSDVIGDANESVKNFGKDNANLKAATQAAELALDGYTALKAGMTALGIESEELMDVFAKLQILQQGLNAVNKIANMLEEQSLLRQQARVIWTKLTTQSIATMAAAKKADAAASAEAAAGDVAMAAGETAATAAAGGLTVALKAVGAAIKSIPIIGWLAAGVAAVATLTALVVKHVKAEKEENEQLRIRKQLTNEIKELEKESLEAIQLQATKLEINIRHMKSLEQGTEEWDEMVKQVADDLGVDKDWLEQNIDKVDDLKDAWVRMQKAMALGEAAAKKMADNEIKAATARMEIEKILNSGDKTKDRTKELQKQFNMSEKTAKNIIKLYDKQADQLKGTSKDFVNYANAVNNFVESLNEPNQALQKIIDDSFEEQLDASNELKEIAGDGIKETGQTAIKESKKVKTAVTKTVKELSDELEDIMVEGMADGLEKQIAEVEKAAKRYIEKMKEAREADLDNKEYYDRIILQYEKNTQDKIKKMRADGYKTILDNAEKLTESYTKLWTSFAPNSFYNFVQEIQSISKEVGDNVNLMNQQITDLQDKIEQYRNLRDRDYNFIEITEEEIARLRKEIEDLPDTVIKVKPVLDENAAPSIDDITSYLQDAVRSLAGVGFNQQAIEIFIAQISSVFNSSEMTDDLKKIQYTLWQNLLSSDGIPNRILQANKSLILDNIEKLFYQIMVPTRAAKMINDVAEAKGRIVDEDKKIAEIEADLDEHQKNYNSDFAKQLLINRQSNKALKEYAKTMQEVLIEQGKLGNISLIPEDFSVYIDYQIDSIEERIARVYNELERMTSRNNDDEAYANELEKYKNLQNELKAYREAKKNTFTDMTMQEGGGGFFDNTELFENARNLQMVANQIAVIEQSMSKGIEIENAVASVTEDNNELYLERLDVMRRINESGDEDAKKRLEEIDSEIAGNQQLIDSLRETMALMGYTSEEEMQQVLNSLLQQEQAFANQTGVIMKKTVASVMQSVSVMVDSLADLMNAIGEDNAEMANFMEGIAYVQIGVNMAAGISEAIAAGAGVPFPANLAAIATGVAAVIGGIASAISTYKQYHKQVSSPNFAEGGVIGMRYARTRQEGRRDDVPINASVGEYIINADAVKKYGIDFFDEINFGHRMPRRRTISFADGGVVDAAMVSKAVSSEESYQMLRDAMSEIQPIVSVREISKAQRRVQVAETVAKR